MNWETAIRVLATIGGAGLPVAMVVAFAARRKVRAEAAKAGADAAAVLGDTAAAMVTEARADMAELRAEHRAEMASIRGEVLALRRHVGVLESLLRINGLPVPDFAWPPGGA